MATEIRYRIMESPQDYHDMAELQEKTRNEVISGIHGGIIYFLEHKPVYTSGLRGMESHFIKSIGSVPVYKIKRGGELTWHGPGQLVIYPVIDFRKAGIGSIREFVNYFGEIIETVLNQHCEIKDAKWDGSRGGIWVDDRKISFSGLHFRKFVSVHGYSLNLSCDTAFFDNIIPCGIPNCKITSAALETGRHYSCYDISLKIIGILKKRIQEIQPYQEEI